MAVRCSSEVLLGYNFVIICQISASGYLVSRTLTSRVPYAQAMLEWDALQLATRCIESLQLARNSICHAVLDAHIASH